MQFCIKKKKKKRHLANKDQMLMWLVFFKIPTIDLLLLLYSLCSFSKPYRETESIKDR